MILARPKSSIFLLNKEEWGGLRWLRLLDLARFEMFINEFLTCLHFFGIHGIGLCYLWDKGFLEIDGMVKGLLRREFPILGLIEEFGAFRVLQEVFVLLSPQLEPRQWRGWAFGCGGDSLPTPFWVWLHSFVGCRFGQCIWIHPFLLLLGIIRGIIVQSFQVCCDVGWEFLSYGLL